MLITYFNLDLFIFAFTFGWQYCYLLYLDGNIEFVLGILQQGTQSCWISSLLIDFLFLGAHLWLYWICENQFRFLYFFKWWKCIFNLLTMTRFTPVHFVDSSMKYLEYFLTNKVLVICIIQRDQNNSHRSFLKRINLKNLNNSQMVALFTICFKSY